MIKVGGENDSTMPDMPQEPVGGPVNEPEMPEPGHDMEMPDEGQGAEDGKADSEIDTIFSKLDTEKQAAVIKYAKSMVDDDAPVEEQDEVDVDDMVTEITNNILSDEGQKPEERDDKKIRNKKITAGNPFASKPFNKK